MNDKRGVIVAGTMKPTTNQELNVPKKVLKKEVLEAWPGRYVMQNVLQQMLCRLGLGSNNKLRCQDWANLQAGRLRAMVVLAIHMTRKTRVARCYFQSYVWLQIFRGCSAFLHTARSEEIQALKDIICKFPGFKPIVARIETLFIIRPQTIITHTRVCCRVGVLMTTRQPVKPFMLPGFRNP